MAALAGVQEPWPYTLRELVWRASALSRDRWNHTALLVQYLTAGPLKRPLRYGQVHPFIAESPDSATAWDEFVFEARGRLPETLTEAEIAARYAEWEAAHG